MTAKAKSNNKAWLYFTLLAVIFIGPIIVSYMLYNFRIFVPETFSHGHLILPPLTLDKLPLQNSQGAAITAQSLKGDWTMLYVEPEKCDKSCLDTLYKMRQVRIRLGKNQDRVQRVILTLQGRQDQALSEYLVSPYQGTIHIQTPATNLNNFLAKLPSHNTAMKTGYLYLVDPLGNVMMSYNPKQSPKDIYADLTRLLKASRIG